MYPNAVNQLKQRKEHILICDVDQFNKHMLNFLLHTVYGKERVKLTDVRRALETELKWSFDEHIPMEDVIREWLDNDYPLIGVTDMSFDSCTELIKKFSDYRIVVYSWMTHKGTTPF